jgi:hypothetical protein
LYIFFINGSPRESLSSASSVFIRCSPQTKKLNGTELRITPGVVPQAIVKGRLVPLTDMPWKPRPVKICAIYF